MSIAMECIGATCVKNRVREYSASRVCIRLKKSKAGLENFSSLLEITSRDVNKA